LTSILRLQLKYYKDKTDLKKVSGEIQLFGDTILQVEPYSLTKKEFVFSLQPSSGKNVRKYVMYANDAATRDKWLEQINNMVMSMRNQ